MSLQISHGFDSGAIEVIACTDSGADLAIRHDALADGSSSEFLQWFHFRASGAEQRGAALRIVNAGATTYPDGWRDYRAVASWNRRDWERIPTRYDGQILTIDLPPAPGPSYISYFEPYSWERHLALLADCISRGARLQRLGASIQGRDIDAIVVGSGERPVWVIARQHPGETMAEWFVDGLLQRLLDESDPVAGALRHVATFYLVSNMNPDGSILGNLRTNAAGANLNREWLTPSLERSPEVLCVRDAMDETGVVYAMDVHGDEAIPANFIAGFEGVPNWTEEQGAAYQGYRDALAAHTPDFQTAMGYPIAHPRKANLTMSTNQLANRFAGCVSMTLEMPFKDHDPNPDVERAWSPQRCKTLAVACLEVLAEQL